MQKPDPLGLKEQHQLDTLDENGRPEVITGRQAMELCKNLGLEAPIDGTHAARMLHDRGIIALPPPFEESLEWMASGRNKITEGVVSGSESGYDDGSRYSYFGD